MLTVKLYADDGFRQRIVEAESLTVLRPQSGDIEITCHGVRHRGETTDTKFDLLSKNVERSVGFEPDFWWSRAIIENANGKTTEIYYSDTASGYSSSPAAVMRA